MAKPPVAAELIWSGDLRFDAVSRGATVVVDGDSAAGPSPVQLLVISLAGCMSIDIVDILRKGRHPITAFRSDIIGERAPEPPTRLVRVRLEFHVQGAVPADAVTRAIALSRDKYCSVWHSLRQDIELLTSFDITP
ncbi:MAG TPA: OsmC family protein [Vicinamibacterales bacterium]|nr:OsmC family protein [Vicinamibacterales bacterium]